MSLLRGEDPRVERRGVETAGEDKRASGADGVRDPFVGEAAQCRFAVGMSCDSGRRFANGSTCGPVDLMDSSDI